MKKKSYSSPEDIHEITVLRDLYEGLLPPRQREVAHLKFDEDLSLSEMSERLGISRQGCDDAIKRCVRALFSYEDRLGFKQKLARRKALVKQVIELVENMDGENWREHKGLALRALQEKMVEGETEDGV
ncbi:MAG TPA: DNA-binding protein [Firmicutes bacterium]|jgi:predicted DNA-binding protein YlxM (UPF0122 family)|nr:DNA-binding protein [Bacillota bacterium]